MSTAFHLGIASAGHRRCDLGGSRTCRLPLLSAVGFGGGLAGACSGGARPAAQTGARL